MATRLNRALWALLRRGLLAWARHSPPAQLLAASQQRARAAAQRAAARSPAYRTLLAEAGLCEDALRGDFPWQGLPVLDKHNTFARFGLRELAGPLRPRELADVLTSSGQGGRTFGLRLSDRGSHAASWFDIDLGLQDAFGVDERPTLLVNCLPMGVVFQSRAVTLANVSVREDMACAILASLAPEFAQTVVCTDPLFVMRLLDEADRRGIDWRALNASLIVGEEMLVEAQREHIARRIGLALDARGPRMVASSFGIAELGLNLLFETREGIAMRRAARRQPGLARLLGAAAEDTTPALMCFNPLRCHIEVLQPDAEGYGQLCFTMLDRHALIGLPRYASGDIGRVLPPPLIGQLASAAGVQRPWLPVVALRGRARDRERGLPSVEAVKEALYAQPGLADNLTGAFRIARHDTFGVVVQVQCKPGLQAVQLQALESRQAAWLEQMKTNLKLTVLLKRWDEFAFRPALDYERKFYYLDPNI